MSVPACTLAMPAMSVVVLAVASVVQPWMLKNWNVRAKSLSYELTSHGEREDLCAGLSIGT